MLLRTEYLSIDPYMRRRMNEGPSYAENVVVGGVMGGGTVCRVLESQLAQYQAGDLVLAANGWQDYATSDGSGVIKLDKTMKHPSWALGVLGMPGFTAHVGLQEIGEPKPGETVVVSAATGAVGSVVGQLAKLAGCRVVGIAGNPEKCAYAVRDLGFDACVNHRDRDFPGRLARACPNGIDVNFENVSGFVLDAVMPLLNTGARVPVCGVISYYEKDSRDTSDHARQIIVNLVLKRVRMQGFIIFDHYGEKYDRFVPAMSDLLEKGLIRYREDVIEGLEGAPQGLMGILRGDNFGKVVVKVD
jgi:NADPH-dependent curcumin reductase CurA